MDLDERPEGIYITPVPYLPGETALTQIERVNGDCSVTSIIITSVEAIHVVDRLREVLAC